MFKASKLDREARRRVVAVLTDPAVDHGGREGPGAVGPHRGRSAGTGATARRCTGKGGDFAERLGEDVSGPALQTVLAKLNEAVTGRAALEERLAEDWRDSGAC